MITVTPNLWITDEEYTVKVTLSDGRASTQFSFKVKVLAIEKSKEPVLSIVEIVELLSKIPPEAI